MKTVWKITLPFVLGEHERTMPQGSEIVSAGICKEALCVWFECDRTEPVGIRQFIIAHTGDLLPDSAEHIATFRDSTFAWHVYARPSHLTSKKST